MSTTITLYLGHLDLDQATLRTVYGAIARLSSHEPGLLSSITFDGSTLQLTGASGNTEQVFAKLGDYLANLPLQQQLESLALSPQRPEAWQVRLDQNDGDTQLSVPKRRAERPPQQNEAA